MELEEVITKDSLTRDELIALLQLEDQNLLTQLYDRAYQLKSQQVGQKVYLRGIIEFSNRCHKDCYYCGIRRSNQQVDRFTMSEEEILASAKFACENNYGSLVLQSGERSDDQFITFVSQIIKKIKELSAGELGITLSLGEQSKETYRKWFELGAHRYLLRIESSKPELYNQLHPTDHDFQQRLSCLQDLRELGYQVGTGVMIGLPSQSVEDLADDLLFFKEYDVDMVGMGPYVLHQNTPLAQEISDQEKLQERNLEWGIRMVALLRLIMPDINIAATTALQALHPRGRELALQAGANILMPIITEQNYRSDYQLYENKPCVDEGAADCRDCLAARVRSVGDEIGYKEWGDAPHYFKRQPGEER